LAGSLDLFSDEFFALQNMDNSLFVDNIIRWCFKKSGLLRISNVKYYAVGKNSESLYTCNDKAHYQLDVEEYDNRSHQWKPYIADDLAVEFVMLDPWVINRLTDHKGSSTYSAEFITPSTAGIYQYKFIYERPGYNFLSEIHRVTVRPRKHDEFDRFLLVALPYYTGTFATIIGSLVFVVLYIYSRESHEKTE
jgi:oligosaccharyltransferase complex subunit beta